MIYLITGNMGTGKSSRAVSMILNNEDGLFKMRLEDGTEIARPLYFCHIDGLDAKKFNAHELTEEQIQSAPLEELLPQGSVLIVDEAHYTYPPRAAGRPVPPYIQKLAELRHGGYTLILMTQHPMQLDVFVRNLVSKHVHLERKSVGMKQYWWYKCVTSLDNPSGVTGAESSLWKPPKDAFKYYKSSSQHVKFKKKLPWAVWALVVILVFMGFKGYGVYDAYKRGTGQDKAESVQAGSGQSDNTFNGIGTNVPSESDKNSLNPEMFVPTLAEKPESKPLYDGVRQVKQYERIAACISGGKTTCTCYSDQATPLKEITLPMCQNYAKNGLPFDPFRQPLQSGQNTQNPAVEASVDTYASNGSQVAVMGAKQPPNLMYDGVQEKRLTN